MIAESPPTGTGGHGAGPELSEGFRRFADDVPLMLWRADAKAGEAFTMLTMEPGPDIAPYHDRQIAILDRRCWADWLDPTIPAKSILAALPAGSLAVEQVG